MNNKGDKGSPYLNSLEAAKKPLGDPLTRTENLAEYIHILTQAIHLSPKPKPFKELMRKSQSTLSKAFSKSNLSIRPGLLEVCSKCNVS